MIKTCVILCGGKGTRLYGNGALQSKPLTLVGDRPMLSHLIDYMIRQKFTNFILLCGYLVEDYKKWYSRENGYYCAKDVSIHIVDTGLDTPTGERVLKAKDLIKDDFILTYGDGLADIDFSKYEKKLMELRYPFMMVTVVRPPARFGVITMNTDDEITSFHEKPTRNDWINGGFIYCARDVIDYLRAGDTFERETIERIMNSNLPVYGYKHEGNWECLDTPKDLEHLENLWETNQAFWSNREKHCHEGRPC